MVVGNRLGKKKMTIKTQGDYPGTSSCILGCPDCTVHKPQPKFHLLISSFTPRREV
jgi:hypothetical protein